MNSIFEELDLDYLYLKKADKKKQPVVRCNTFINISKNDKVVKRLRVAETHNTEDRYGNCGIAYTNRKGAASTSYIDLTGMQSSHISYRWVESKNDVECTKIKLGSPKCMVINNLTFETNTDFLSLPGDSKLVDSFGVESGIHIMSYKADTAIVYGHISLSPSPFRSNNKMYDGWNALNKSQGAFRKVKYNKGKLNRSELNFISKKIIDKIELL